MPDGFALHPNLPVFDPYEPRIMPQAAGFFTINRLVPCRLKTGETKPRMLQSVRPLARYAADVGAVGRSVDTYVSQAVFEVPQRRVVFLAWATHALVDLDTHNDPDLAVLTQREMLNELRWFCDDHDIPQPSMILFSGRGFYLKWFWSQPIPRAEAGRATAINRQLVRKLARFHADPAAVDMARIARIVGTVNAKTMRPVEIVHLNGSENQPLTYDFDDFCRAILPIPADDHPDSPAHATLAEAPRDAPPGGSPRRFGREAWHWGVLEDLRTLAAERYPRGMVEAGERDLFGHLAACQLARVVPTAILRREIVATVSTFLPPDYVDGELPAHSSTLLARAALAHKGERVPFAGSHRTPIYTYTKTRMLDLLRIEPHEERRMTRLISDAEKRRRETNRRRANGVVSRDEYCKLATERRTLINDFRTRGMSWRTIAAELGVSLGEAHRLGQT